MKIRAQRSSLKESLKTVQDIPATEEAVRDYIESQGISTCLLPVEVRHYCFDSRTGWDTYIVTLDGAAVCFTDGPVETQLVPL